MKTGQTIYVVIGTDVHETKVKKFDGKWLDIEPIYLRSWDVTINVLEVRIDSSGRQAPWGAYESRKANCHHYARMFTIPIDAQKMAEKVALVREIRPLISVNRSLATLKKIKEVLDND